MMALWHGNLIDRSSMSTQRWRDSTCKRWDGRDGLHSVWSQGKYTRKARDSVRGEDMCNAHQGSLISRTMPASGRVQSATSSSCKLPEKHSPAATVSPARRRATLPMPLLAAKVSSGMPVGALPCDPSVRSLTTTVADAPLESMLCDHPVSLH